MHDEHLSAGAFHLFRLPEEAEQDLHQLIESGIGQATVAEMGQGQEFCLSALSGLAGAGKFGSVGPVAIGTINDDFSLESMNAAAGHYHNAFVHRHKTYPYWAASS